MSMADPRESAPDLTVDEADGCEPSLASGPDETEKRIVETPDEVRLRHIRSRLAQGVITPPDLAWLDWRLRAALSENARRRKALTEIAGLSDKPSDFDGWYDSFGDYADCDPSNAGDVHEHGGEMGRWHAAKIARAALASSGERAKGSET